jgi:hypothetical protein
MRFFDFQNISASFQPFFEESFQFAVCKPFSNFKKHLRLQTKHYILLFALKKSTTYSENFKCKILNFKMIFNTLMNKRTKMMGL